MQRPCIINIMIHLKENDPILRLEFRSVLIDRLGASGVSGLVEFHSCPGQINKEREKKACYQARNHGNNKIVWCTYVLIRKCENISFCTSYLKTIYRARVVIYFLRVDMRALRSTAHFLILNRENISV